MNDVAKPEDHPRARLDKWLWAARFYKTRSLAADEIARGRVDVNGLPAKPGRELHVGDTVAMRQGAGLLRSVQVLALSGTRGPASVAQLLYRETPQSIADREAAAQRRRDGVEPAATLAQGRPTKRDRRELGQLQDRWQRWSASIDEL